uniref:PATJ crumbs cell polarity complex component n=1 Tax=Hucho hucho TaxID=62062 RepID=A0A4W5M5W6_9TELE
NPDRPFSTVERQQVLLALERLQAKMAQREEWTHSERLGMLRDALQSPLLGHILTLQHSIKQLKDQLNCMPPDTCSDFSFSRKGQLIVSANRPASSLCTSGPGSVLSNGSALGRQTEHISLPKPLSGGLGFSVVDLRAEGTRGHGVFITQVQPRSIAHGDGRIQENDQILVINGTPLDQSVTQHQAIALLQQPGDRVDLVVARDPATITHVQEQWGHMEEIELLNDGSGLGFGIVGGMATGVVVRTLVPNSVADKDGRLRTGDHILRIGETPTGGLASDQVVKVLQGCGSHVRMLIARDPSGQHSTSLPPPPPPAASPISALPAGVEPQHRVNVVGVFVKNVVPGSAAEQSGNIRIYDRIIELLPIHTMRLGVELDSFDGHHYISSVAPEGPVAKHGLLRPEDELLEVLDRHRTTHSTTHTHTQHFPCLNAYKVTMTFKNIWDVVWQEDGESLGISIVGGHSVIKRLKNGKELKGIFIKQVLPESPAGRTRSLKTGDKILQVSGVDLQNACHDEAVQAIKTAPSPVVFIVQSLSATPRVNIHPHTHATQIMTQQNVFIFLYPSDAQAFS